MPLGVHFNDTITLGTGLVLAIAALFALYRVALGARLKAINDVLSREVEAKDGEIERLDREASQTSKRLNELGAEKDAALQTMAACEATIKTLQDQLDKVPAYQEFMDYGKSMMLHVDSQAAGRQEQFMGVVLDKLQVHDTHVEQIHMAAEKKAAERHEAQLEVLHEIAAALRKDHP